MKLLPLLLILTLCLVSVSLKAQTSEDSLSLEQAPEPPLQEVFLIDYQVDMKVLDGIQKLILKASISDGLAKVNFNSSDDTMLTFLNGEALYDFETDRGGKLLLINQSHDNDEDNDTTTIQFKLKHRRFRLFNYNLPLGEYTLHLWFYDENSGERGLYRDVFQII